MVFVFFGGGVRVFLGVRVILGSGMVTGPAGQQGCDRCGKVPIEMSTQREAMELARGECLTMQELLVGEQ